LRFVALALVLAVVPGPAYPPSPPPVPAALPVTQTFYGTSVTDPYGYFQNMDDPVVVRFFREQNAYTRALLSSLGAARERLYERIQALDKAGTVVSNVIRDGPYYFYEKLTPNDSSPKLYMRGAEGGVERLLIDPGSLATAGRHYSISYFLPSLDGRYVEYGISEGGSEAATIHVVETMTARVLTDKIDRAQFAGATSWLPDGKSFYYVRLPKPRPGETDAGQETRYVAYRHLLGRNPDNDPAIFGFGVNSEIPFGPADFPAVIYSPASPYTLAVVSHGVQNELTIYAARASIINSAAVAWKRVVRPADDVSAYDVKGSTIYLLTHKNSPRFEIVATSLDAPKFANARTIVPSGTEIT
jgi:prolyl oligopeptidase